MRGNLVESMWLDQACGPSLRKGKGLGGSVAEPTLSLSFAHDLYIPHWHQARYDTDVKLDISKS